MASINEATGEVTLELGGHTFRLKATIPRVADYEEALGVKGLGGIQQGLQESQTRAVYEGLRCLCTSGNEADLDDLLLLPTIAEATQAIFQALTAGLPAGTSRGNGRATTMKTPLRRGRDTDSLPSAT